MQPYFVHSLTFIYEFLSVLATAAFVELTLRSRGMIFPDAGVFLFHSCGPSPQRRLRIAPLQQLLTLRHQVLAQSGTASSGGRTFVGLIRTFVGLIAFRGLERARGLIW